MNLSRALSHCYLPGRIRFFRPWPRKVLIKFIVFTSGLALIIIVYCLSSFSGKCSSSSLMLPVNRNTWTTNISTLRKRNTWMRITDSIFTYSAYIDQREPKSSFVRIIGLWKVPPREELRKNPIQWMRIKEETSMRDSYSCTIFYQENNAELVSAPGAAFTREIFEEGLKTYAGCFFKCYIPNKIQHLLQHHNMQIQVAIYPQGVENYPAKLLDVENVTSYLKNNEIQGMNKSAITVCVRPIFGPMDDLRKLAQFISFYHTIGVNRFVFYTMSISPRIRLYFEALKKLGINIRQNGWNLPTGNWKELWDFGSLAALNDCTYSQMNGETVVIVDLDEYIVPQLGNSLRDLINFNEASKKKVQLLVRNTFFCEEYCGQTNLTDKLFPIFSCPVRTKRVWNAQLRSKYILNFPNRVIQVGHHCVTKFLEQSKSRVRLSDYTYEFSPEIAKLNHYRKCGPISTRTQPVLTRLTVPDLKISHFEEQVMNSIPAKVVLKFLNY